MQIEPAHLTPFDSPAHTRLVFGRNAVERVGELARELGAEKILLVTDPGIVAAGHSDHVTQHLQSAGFSVALFSQVQENPTTRCVEQCRAVAREAKVDLIIGLGGGSAMDTAKGCNFILTNGGQMRDYWGVGKASRPLLPMIAIPTTAGTGSECQSAALISDAETHQKMACLDPKAAPRIALLDPVLTLSQPVRVTALTGIDALAHAVESAVTARRNAISSLYSHRAFTLLCQGFPLVLKHPENLEARAQMQLGAALAGLAIENSMLGAAHAAANPLTAHHEIVHGQAVGLMLPHIIRFNREDPEAARIYSELAITADVASSRENLPANAGALAGLLVQFLRLAELPISLADLGVAEASIPQLAEEAARQWTAQFNPRKVMAQDFATLYRQALS